MEFPISYWTANVVHGIALVVIIRPYPAATAATQTRKGTNYSRHRCKTALIVSPYIGTVTHMSQHLIQEAQPDEMTAPIPGCREADGRGGEDVLAGGLFPHVVGDG